MADLLPPDVLKRLPPIMNRIQRGELDVSAGKAEILRILEPYRARLEAKGVLADYLAWVIASMGMGPGGPLSGVRLP